MTPVKVWQERVEIPTYETGRRIYIPCSWKIAFIRDRPARLSLRRDRYAERAENPEILAGVWLENDYIKVMILPELGGRGIAHGIK